jgi:hypothetical protein
MPLKTSAAVALSLLLIPAAATAAKHPTAHPKRVAHKHVTHKKHHVRRYYRWRGYGFLPGYVPPEVAEREREEEYRRRHPFYGPAWPRFYHGRWNGGGFGPCYVSTPIGYMWTCGK